MLRHDSPGLHGINTMLRKTLIEYSGLMSVQLNVALGSGQRIPLYDHPTKQSKVKFSQDHIVDSKLNRCFGLHSLDHFVEAA
jgi:hypothetical protein